MAERNTVLLLILIMASVCVVVAGVGTYTLYHAAFEQEREHLVETAQSQARLIEAVARFDALHSNDAHPEGWVAATLSQVIDWHKRYKGFGKTGEFTLAKLSGDQIVFLLSHRHYDLDNPKPIPLDSRRGEPMRRALSGSSGTVIGLDYRGAEVLAAHEPVSVLNWGIVAKIDLAEVRAPFIRAWLIATGVGLVVVVAGAVLFIRIGTPLVHRLQENEARMRAILKTAADGILIVNSDGVIESFNNAAQKIFGYASHEIIGRDAHKLMGISDDAEPTGLLGPCGEATDRGGGAYREMMGWREDGTSFPIELGISEVRRNGRSAFMAIVRDITERKEAEDTLARTLAVLKQSNKELQEFAYVASHDLKEPLRMVASYTQLLEKRYNNILDDDAREFIRFAVDGASRMEELIDGLHSYAQVGVRPKVLESVDSKVVLEQAIADLAVSIEQNDATITHSDLPTVIGDPLQLRQLWQNLIDNAVKFRRDTVPRIHVSAEASDEEWIFSVRDNGIGIDPTYKDRVFVIFQRLHTREEYPGTGVGLALCKKIVERHGGRIWVESESGGEGATIFFTLPLGTGGKR